MASALILSRYNSNSIPDVIKKIESMDSAQHFDYLWEEILHLNPLVLGVFTNKAVTASQGNPILPDKE